MSATKKLNRRVINLSLHSNKIHNIYCCTFFFLDHIISILQL